MKFTSGNLKSQGYNITTTFDESYVLGEIVKLSDSQALRSIREIRKRALDREKVERLFKEKELLYKRCAATTNESNNPKIDAYQERIEVLKNRIHRTMFMEDYISVEIEHESHYKYMYENGFVINGKSYRRFSCSAGQARNSIVIFVAADILDDLEKRLNNGRDISKKLAPSKFNAYYGLYTTATYLVPEPRIAVVKDYEDCISFVANFVTETDWDIDDTIEIKEVTVPMNRTDGMGLISPAQAARWAKELNLDYVPGQWVIRQSFLKGLVVTFDFHKFCDEKNNGCYIIDTVYSDANGDSIKVDLRNVDIIISESQFKLWDSYASLTEYIDNCRINKLYWGVSRYSPKISKDILRLNYQFIQTLNLNHHDVEQLCKMFVNWVERVSYKDRAYMLLFLLGKDVTEDQVQAVFAKMPSSQMWIKAIAANPECVKDPFIRHKIYDLIQGKIDGGCVGEILVKGNFQYIITDPYAYMQHVCGQIPIGLLHKGEYYCNYWNQRGVTKVDSMRSPMTFRSEHVIANLVNNDEMQKWYQYCTEGFILNWHGNETVLYSGCDFDGDIIATTDNETMIKCVYQDELPVVYDAPKPKKVIFTKDDLFQSDLFGFGSTIGPITNCGSDGTALLPVLEEKYGENSDQARLVKSRMMQCCVAQSRQIDKTKIGRPVKGIPKVWGRYSKIDDSDTEEQIAYKKLMNDCLLNRRPYFFRYRYTESNTEYINYQQKKDAYCKVNFNMSLTELMAAPQKTLEQHEWLRQYYDFCPLVDSDSAMNLVCKYIESIDFQIKEKIRWFDDFDYTIYMSDGTEWIDCYNDIVKCYSRFVKNLNKSSMGINKKQRYKILQEQLKFIQPNSLIVTDCLVWYAYGMHSGVKKELIWDAYAYQMYSNAMRHASAFNGKISIPILDPNGEIEYLGRLYTMKEVDA